MKNLCIGYYEFEINHIDKLDTYIVKDKLLYWGDKSLNEIKNDLISILQSEIDKAASNKLIRKRYKNKTAILEAIHNHDNISYTISIQEIINPDNMNLSHDEITALHDNVNFHHIIDYNEYNSKTLAYIETCYDLNGNKLKMFECDCNNEYSIRRELSDYEDDWKFYELGDIVKLKRPYFIEYWSSDKSFRGYCNEVIITQTPTSHNDYTKNNKYTTFWGNRYEGVPVNCLYAFISNSDLHYDDIDCCIGKFQDKELLDKFIKD